MTPKPYVYRHRTVFVHRPHIVNYNVIHFPRPHLYYLTVRPIHIYFYWILEPVYFYVYDGYQELDNYPYYVYHGYRHRYSPVEMCQYELVDGEHNTVARTYGVKECNLAYDQCAMERDDLNDEYDADRFFCAERVEDEFAQSDDSQFSGLPMNLDPVTQLEVKSYLQGRNYHDIWSDGIYGQFGEKCEVVKLRNNIDDCRYMVSVGGQFFPDPDGNICSSDYAAKEVGCALGNEKDNAGCILRMAIEMGYCHGL